MAGASAVPVVIYHSVADPREHPWSRLSIPVRVLANQLAYLRRAGFTTLSLYELLECLNGRTPTPPKTIVLTFDDGFLDNWVYAFPLLRKWGMRATVFVSTDFVDPREECRPNLEDVWAGRASEGSLHSWGYLSWAELRAMSGSGTIDVQSHGASHAWHFGSDRIVDFHHPGDDYVWLYWNAYRERKPRWLNEDVGGAIPWGTPVYEFGPGLLTRRYYDDPGLADALADHVARNGRRGFFRRRRWRETLLGLAAAYRSLHGSGGRYESEAEYRLRILAEFLDSKRLIEARLGTSVDFFCWPAGAFSPALHRAAIEEAGYLATVATERGRGGSRDPSTLIVDRLYFGQDYQGPWRSELLLLKFIGVVNHRAGRPWGSALVFLANRMMGLLRGLRVRRRRG